MTPPRTRPNWPWLLMLGLCSVAIAFGNITTRELRTAGSSRGSAILLGSLVAGAGALLACGIVWLLTRRRDA